MCFSRSRIEVSPSDYDQQVRSSWTNWWLACEFAVDAQAKRILFKGGFFLEGANFRLFDALLENFRTGKKADTEIAFIRAPDLATMLSVSDASLHQQVKRGATHTAERLGISEASLRQQVGRLRELVARRLAVDLGIVLGSDDIIENRQREGHRLSPAPGEVSRGDLGSTSVTSHA
jgi:DNA-binding transcriptional regulator YdaS (Cro superfamily)